MDPHTALALLVTVGPWAIFALPLGAAVVGAVLIARGA
jgi:hypothetical protein